ncbi:hypothetical protein ACX12L_22580, partial [Alicycliphilus sp. T452]
HHRPPRRRRRPRTYPQREREVHESGWVKIRWKWWVSFAWKSTLSPFESQWILWSYCVRRFGRAILPTVPLCNQEHGCEVLAMLSEMPVGDVRDAVASRRLHAWALLDGIGAYGETPSLLSNWLSATDKFADLIEQPYASDSDLLSALCQAHVSLMASR